MDEEDSIDFILDDNSSNGALLLEEAAELATQV